MTDLGRIGDLLELIYTAYDNFTSMSATFTYRYIPSILHEEINELAAQNPGSVAPLKRIGSVRNNQERAFNGVSGFRSLHPGDVRTMRWARKPIFISSMEITGGFPHSPTLTRLESALNNAQFADPSFFLSSLILNPVGSTFHAGREAILVKAVPRKNRAPVWDSLFWSAADEIDLLVDKERGVLLRYSAKRNGDEYAVASAESIAFDEPIPESSFYFVPEPNMQIHVVDAQ